MISTRIGDRRVQESGGEKSLAGLMSRRWEHCQEKKDGPSQSMKKGGEGNKTYLT